MIKKKFYIFSLKKIVSILKHKVKSTKKLASQFKILFDTFLVKFANQVLTKKTLLGINLIIKLWKQNCYLNNVFLF